MKRLDIYRLLVPIMVLVLFLPFLLPAHASTVYAAGVTVGQWASYAPVNVTYHEIGTGFPEPQAIKDQNATVQFTATVQHLYSSTNVTLQSVTQYKNGTTQTAIRNGDLMSGMGNLTFVLIAGGLSTPSPLWNAPYTPTVNQTVSRTYLGVSRAVNIYNTTYRQPFVHGFVTIGLEYVWDQISGITLEFKGLNVYPATTRDGGFSEYSDVKIQSTNIFPNPYSPDFDVSAMNPSPVASGESATFTVTITAVNRFGDTVTLTDTVPSGLTCNAISPKTLPGHGTASLSCHSTTPETYTVNITATSGPTSHTTTTIVTVTARPNQTPNAPILGLTPQTLYETIGTIILAITATVTYLVLRTKREGQVKTTTTPATVASARPERLKRNRRAVCRPNLHRRFRLNDCRPIGL